MQTFTLTALENMGIHELRVLGRTIGVHQPTSRKKDDLIDAILRVQEERAVLGDKFVYPVIKQGRRPLSTKLQFADSAAADADEESESQEKPTGELRILGGTLTDVNTAFGTADTAIENAKPVHSKQHTQKRTVNAGVENKNGGESKTNIEYKNSGENKGKTEYKYNSEYRNNNESKNNADYRNIGEYRNNNESKNNYEYKNNGENKTGYEKSFEKQYEKPYEKSYDKPFDAQKTEYKRDDRRFNQEDEQDTLNATDSIEIKEGVLEIMADGYGFLRAINYEAGEMDAYISAQKIRKARLRKGDWIKAEAKKLQENRPAGIVNILEVNGCPPENAFERKHFDNLVPVYPNSRFKLELESSKNDFAIRSVDLVAPIGKGQRAMIVSPPKAGKTTLLKKIANSISINYPEAHLMVLLIDERPEEVTDMRRSIDGEVVFSTFDEMPEHHTKAAELVLERAKRLVELGTDVVILMDSLTRLARAYNLTISPTGRTLSGGIDPGALHSPKRFFGAARNIEEGGSLTIIATALVDTGSRMDDVIYEEFKGTGNMEIHLDRKLSEKRIFPAIDLGRSGTRREDLLLNMQELQGVWAMRKILSAGDSMDATENLIGMLIKTKTNKEFIEQLNMKIMQLEKQGLMIKQ